MTMISIASSKTAIFAVFSILLSFPPCFIGAWVFPSGQTNVRIAHHPISVRHGRNNNVIVANRKWSTINNGGSQKQLSATQLSLFKYKDTSDEISVPIVELSAEQDQILRDSASSMEEAYGMSWFQKEASWDELKNKHSSLLQEFSNDELRRAYIAQKPNPIDLLLKTPLGPFLAVNLFFLLGGFSWCDTPFLNGSDTCLP